jgi:hypothetical protein
VSVTETLGGLGSWDVKLSDTCPDEKLQQLDFLGHVVIVRGRVDVSATSASLLAAARYVGVLRQRSKDRRTLSGDGMLFWLGDEDDKGKILETAVNLSGASISTAVNAVLPPAVHAGTINTAAGTYTGKHQYETPRSALDTITAAFNVEYRVNGTGTIDVGTQAQLYRTTPNTIIAAKNAGQDLDLTSLGATFDVDESIRDYSTRVLLLGSSYDDGTTTTFATGSADAPSVPYKDLFGNTYQATRMISESGTPTGTVTQRAQLQLNRFNRAATALKVSATDYEIAGPFAVGDNAYVYDPANGIQDAARSIDFRGELIHPDVVRISGATWPVTEDHTVAFRTNAGAWIDLTPWVVWESGGGEITVGDLPKSLTSAAGNPVIDRADSLPDTTIPTAPTGLSLSTFAVNDPRGGLSAVIRASWTAPTLNTDGSVITDLTSYWVRWRVLGRPAWQASAVGVTQFDIPVLIDTDYEVQVAAVDRTNHTSAFTASVTIHASVDTVAPNAPSDPAVTSYLGQLRIAWDGKDNTGAAMPNDFNRVDVHVSATTGFTPSTATLVASLSTAGVAYATAPYGVTRYVKLIAYDNAANASAASGQVSGATTQVADGDVAALSVGKLTAGIMSADVTVSGRFATALTGARVEMNSLGFQKFDALSNLLVSITGTDALLTGIYKTALTGRRIEIGAAGSSGRVQFYAPDGTLSQVGSFTADDGTEAVRIGVPITGKAGYWNHLQVQSNQNVYLYAAYTQLGYGKRADGTSGQFLISQWSNQGTSGGAVPTGITRMAINDTDWSYWDAAGKSRFDINSTQVILRDNVEAARLVVDATTASFFGTSGTTTPVLSFRKSDGYWLHGSDIAGSYQEITRDGTMRWHYSSFDGWFEFMTSGTAGGTSPRFRMFTDSNFGNMLTTTREASTGIVYTECISWDNSVYQPMRASGFVVVSDENTKTDIADATVSATALIDSAPVKNFRRKGGKGGRMPVDDKGKPGAAVDAGDGPVEVGFLAQQMPAQVIVAGEKALGLDMGQVIALLWKDSQETHARLAALEKGKK